MDLEARRAHAVKSPGLTIVAVLALAVAIGAGAAYLEFVTRLAASDAAVRRRRSHRRHRELGRREAGPSRALAHDFHFWRETACARSRTSAPTRPLERNLITEDGRGEPVAGRGDQRLRFRVVPTPPLLGRPLTDDDERPGAPPVVVIGHDLWRARFDGDPAVVGRTIRLGDVPHTIVGVMPRGFGFPSNHGPLGAVAAGDELRNAAKGPRSRSSAGSPPARACARAQAEMKALAATAGTPPSISICVRW